MYLGNATAERRAWTGTIQLAPEWGQIRFSTVGLNTALAVPAEFVAGIQAAQGHCVRIEGTMDASSLIHVEGWAILPDGAEFTEGGLTYTCGEFKPKVALPGVVPDPAPAVTGGGTVTTTGTLPPGTDPTTAPVEPGAGSSGGALGSMVLPLLAVGALFLFVRPGRN